MTTGAGGIRPGQQDPSQTQAPPGTPGRTGEPTGTTPGAAQQALGNSSNAPLAPPVSTQGGQGPSGLGAGLNTTPQALSKAQQSPVDAAELARLTAKQQQGIPLTAQEQATLTSLTTPETEPDLGSEQEYDDEETESGDGGTEVLEDDSARDLDGGATPEEPVEVIENGNDEPLAGVGAASGAAAMAAASGPPAQQPTGGAGLLSSFPFGGAFGATPGLEKGNG